MTIKTRAIKKTQIRLRRNKSDEYIDGIYVKDNFDEVLINAIVQPYQGDSYQQDTDGQVLASSVILFSEDEIILGDEFLYSKKLFRVQRVDEFMCSHFEAIAHDTE